MEENELFFLHLFHFIVTESLRSIKCKSILFFWCLAPNAISSGRFGPAVATEASSQVRALRLTCAFSVKIKITYELNDRS